MIKLEDLQIEMVFVITEEGEHTGWGPRGSKATIKSIKLNNGNGSDINIGMYFQTAYDSKYHDLDGMVKFGHGYWLVPAQLLSPAFVLIQEEEVVLHSGIKLGERDIGNKQGHILKHFSNTGHVMVELLEDVKGCSGDGLGKAGHCVILKKDKISFKKSKYKEKKKGE